MNSLAAHTSALGVTIVLSLRKLVSLFISISLFGNRLPLGVMLGAAIVFGSAGMWAWDGQRRRGRKAGGQVGKAGGGGTATEAGKANEEKKG